METDKLIPLWFLSQLHRSGAAGSTTVELADPFLDRFPGHFVGELMGAARNLAIQGLVSQGYRPAPTESGRIKQYSIAPEGERMLAEFRAAVG